MRLDELQKKLYKGEITHLDFLKSSKNYPEFAAWCEDHGVSEDESNAEFFYDMTFHHEHADADISMEIYP